MVHKFKRDISWANDPITITRINEHSHPSKWASVSTRLHHHGLPSSLGLRLHYLQNNAILRKFKFYIKLNGTRAIFNFTTHNKIRPMICTMHQHTRKTYNTKQDHISIYKQEHMAIPILIMSIAITRNRVLGFKN